MQTNQPPETSHTAAHMDLPAARKHLHSRVEILVTEWRKQNPTFFHKTAGQLTFLEDFGLRRQANGYIKLFDPFGPRHMPRGNDLDLDWPTNWIMSAAQMKTRGLMLAELKRLTGNNSLDLRNLGALMDVGLWPMHTLLGDRVGWIDIKPLEKEIINFLDPAILAITLRARDTMASLATYNLIAANQTLWLRLEAQAPNLMPLVSLACRKKKVHLDQNAFRSLKRYGRQHGLTEAGWKVLCRFPVEAVRRLCDIPVDYELDEPPFSLEPCFRIASHYGETGLLPPMPLLVRHINFCRRQQIAPDAIPVWFHAAAIREFQRQEKHDILLATDCTDSEYLPALDWLTDYMANGGKPDAHQKKAGWQWIQRQSEAWHEEQVREQVTTHYTWSSALDAYVDEGYEVVPLTTSVDLAVEGTKMHHCVGSYADVCNVGRSRIFSIRKDGKSLATAELVYDNRGKAWVLNQNRGPCNSTPDPDIMAVAHRLEEAYNAAVRLVASARESINRL